MFYLHDLYVLPLNIHPARYFVASYSRPYTSQMVTWCLFLTRIMRVSERTGRIYDSHHSIGICRNTRMMLTTVYILKRNGPINELQESEDVLYV